MDTQQARAATLYRMVMPEHTCPFGLKSRYLLHRKGCRVDDRWLKTREQTDAFKAEQHVETTPQPFIEGKRIGGYDDPRRFFGLAVRDPAEPSYRPVIAVFAVALLLAAASLLGSGQALPGTRLAGLLMVSGRLPWLAVALAAFIGSVGAVSLMENLMMVAMAILTAVSAVGAG